MLTSLIRKINEYRFTGTPIRTGTSALALALAVMSGPASGATEDAAAQKPNFIVILADDLGYNDLGCFGSPLIKTPNIDRMAKEGARFTDFYSAPSCTPARAAFISGCYPQRLGFGDNLGNVNGHRSPSSVLHPNSPYGLNPSEKTIAEVLKSAGYATGMVGKWHLGDAEKFNPVNHGFDFFFGVPYSNDMKPYYYLRGTERQPGKVDNNLVTSNLTTEALGFIRENRDKPFFLYFAHAMPHTPLGTTADFKDKSPRGAFGDAVQEVDWSVGEVLKTVKEIGADDRTLVVFLSDNGPWLIRGENGGSATPLRNGKASSYEGGIRVPCVMRWPGVIPAGTASKAVAANIDFLPTFAAQAGATVPSDNKIDGKDISALLKNPASAKSPHDKFFYYFGNQLHAVRSGKWKFRAKNNLKNENVYRKQDRELLEKVPIPAALYNLEVDPGEQKDVSKHHPKITKRLQGYLAESRKDLGDSLTGVEGQNLREVGTVEAGE